MGRITNNSEVEIIPLGDLNSVNKRSITRPLHKRSKMQRQPYMSDPTIVPRVQKYLESNVDKTFVDINSMADDLQSAHREYAKRKRSAFRASVKKAYGIVLQSYGLQDHETSEDEEDDVSEEETAAEHHNRFSNSLSAQLVDLYSRPAVVPKHIDENELIDISSDDSEDKATYANNKPSNGPSTSQQQANYQNNYNVKKPVPENLKNDRYQAIARNSSYQQNKKRKLDVTPNISIISKGPAKKKKQISDLEKSATTFKDVGGMDKILEDVCKLLVHIKHPELYQKIGISPPRGFLLHGPPGCGKTLLANAIAGELNIPLLKVAAPELVAGVSGESEERIRELFEKAAASAPCVLFIDEIDAITQSRQNAQKEMERRIVAQLLSCLDDLGQNNSGDRVLVVGATNRPDSIDPALRRAGRFDREICLGIPDVQSRLHILKVLTQNLRLAENFDYESLAKYTPGYVGADLLSLTRESAMSAVNRVFNELRDSRKIEEPPRQASPVSAPAVEPPKEQATSPEVVVEEEESKDAASNDSNKSDPEIVVDDEATKELATPPSNEANDKECVVVDVDDEQNKPNNAESKDPESSLEVVNGEDVEVAEPQQEPMPVDNVVKQLTPLEELISWLHDKTPITDAQLQSLSVTMDDFAAALKCVQPSAKREGFATVPDTTWADVGSLSDVREELQMAILAPVRHAEQFERLGLNVPTGVLLCGPPGCGKTLLAKAVANEAGINFISVKGPELLNMYVGESERAVRVCFERARNSAPCVIFFDELDALVPKRTDSRDGGPTMRVVNQMLTEMDGVEGRKGVFLLAASNRPDIVDPAVLRPGRLDKIIYVGLPTALDRVDILRAITKNGTRPQLASEVDLSAIGSSDMCAGYTGADLAALVREAGVQALRDFMVRNDGEQTTLVSTEHFKRAVAKIRPSVTEKDKQHYEKLRKTYTAVPEQAEVEEMEYS
ncbi:unnamed protein product [Brassicogethes aeneus]|uniref:AAA+ ATPase domain-containing protein n=1 Tax=Brassicogethes aeneus TaxID=1431903 RepID=A0A9P0FB69_BRAAE|nr:unnamed protein product [Brassicogethes aeneus]